MSIKEILNTDHLIIESLFLSINLLNKLQSEKQEEENEKVQFVECNSIFDF